MTKRTALKKLSKLKPKSRISVQETLTTDFGRTSVDFWIFLYPGIGKAITALQCPSVEDCFNQLSTLIANETINSNIS